MTIIERTWRCRGYELDQDLLIPPAVLLRYLEQMRWSSMEPQSNLRLERLFQSGHNFVVAAQRLQVVREVGLGATLWGDLTIGHVGRSSWEFRTLLRDADAEGDTVARGSVVAVYLDPQHRPTPLPDDVRAMAQEHVGEAWGDGGAMNVPSVPTVGPPATSWQHTIQVRPSDQDLLRHVNHAVYLDYVDDTRRFCAHDGGYGEVVAGGRIAAVTLEYLQEAVQGQTLDCHTWVTQDDPLTLGFVISREGKPICRAGVMTEASTPKPTPTPAPPR